jgi:hypothetical protein
MLLLPRNPIIIRQKPNHEIRGDRYSGPKTGFEEVWRDQSIGPLSQFNSPSPPNDESSQTGEFGISDCCIWFKPPQVLAVTYSPPSSAC